METLSVLLLNGEKGINTAPEIPTTLELCSEQTIELLKGMNKVWLEPSALGLGSALESGSEGLAPHGIQGPL